MDNGKETQPTPAAGEPQTTQQTTQSASASVATTAPPVPNGQSAPEDAAAIKAQLEEERAARAAAEQAAAEKEARLVELQATLTQTQAEAQAIVATLRDKAIPKYLQAARLLNPTVPSNLIVGATIEEIDASVEMGKAVVDSVKTSMAAEAAKTRVPAGAPTRSGPPTEGMTAREKIAYGIQQKGGSS